MITPKFKDENSKAHLDLSGGVIDVTIAKVEKGLHFEDLDLLSKLLATKSELYEMENPGKSVQEDSDSKPKKGILIEELGEELKNISIEEDFDDETEESDWEMPQEIPQDEILNAKYGFNRQYNGYFTHVHETANEILEVPQVEKTSNSERVELQKQSEDAAFDEDYYMENFVNEQEIQSILEFIPKSVHTSRLLIENEKMKKGQDSSKRKEKIVEFTERERDVILSLPRRDYLIDNKRAIYLGLIDILFGYCYNERVTESEPDNVESAWTIGKLTGTCSFLREYEDIYQVLQSNIRRALTYPLYRNWNLAIKALEDVTEILRTGNKVLLTKIMLEIKYIFDHHS
ncbi:Protein shq1, partial [Zancudomyces culisetae]